MGLESRFGPHGPFDADERAVVADAIDTIRRRAKPGYDTWLAALFDRIDILERLGQVLDSYPSLSKAQSIGSRSRDLETLIDTLSRCDLSNFDIYLPTRALLGRDLVMAEVNFYRLLRLACRDTLDPPGSETWIRQVERRLCLCLYARLAEEVLKHIASDHEVATGTRRKAVLALVHIWERNRYRIQDVFPILEATWEARRRVPSQLGTLLGTAELFGLVREGCDPAFVDYLAGGDQGDDEASAFREFLFGARTEDLDRLAREMSAARIPSVRRERACEVIDLADAFDPDRDPAIALFEFFLRRHHAAGARRLMHLPGPKRTAEEYVMLRYLEDRSESAR